MNAIFDSTSIALRFISDIDVRKSHSTYSPKLWIWVGGVKEQKFERADSGESRGEVIICNFLPAISFLCIGERDQKDHNISIATDLSLC